MVTSVESYLKERTEALVKDIGVEAACAATGKSKATLGRYYSAHPEHATRFMPVDAVARLEQAAHRPYLSEALAELANGDSLGARAARLAQDPEAARELRALIEALEARAELRPGRTG